VAMEHLSCLWHWSSSAGGCYLQGSHCSNFADAHPEPGPCIYALGLKLTAEFDADCGLASRKDPGITLAGNRFCRATAAKPLSWLACRPPDSQDEAFISAALSCQH